MNASTSWPCRLRPQWSRISFSPGWRSAMPRNSLRKMPPIMATARPAFSASGQIQSSAPSCKSFCSTGCKSAQRSPIMPGWLRQPAINALLAGFLGSNWPIPANRSGYFRAASSAISCELGSQLIGGWIRAASTPASSISFSISSAVTWLTLRCLPVVGTTVWRQMWTCASMIFTGFSSVRCRGGRVEQLLALELAPQLGRDFRRQAAGVLLDLGGAERPRDHRAQRGMEQRELHRRRAEFDAVALAHGFDLARDVDLRQPKAQMGVLERAHHAVVAVIEHRREAGQPVLAEVGRRLLAGLQRVQDAADLGRQHVGLARPLAQGRPHAQFAAAVAVERRGVEIAHAQLIGGVGQRYRLGIGDRGAEATHRRAAQAKRGDFEPGLADPAAGKGHGVFLRDWSCWL